MTMFRRITRIPIAMIALMLVPSVGHAQIGGLIKRKTAEAVKGQDKTEEKTTDQGISLGGARELTAANIDALLEGLKTEVTLRDEFKTEVAKYPTREQYNKCQQDAAMSPESQKLLEILNLPDNATAEQQQAAAKKFAEEGAAMLKKKCPLDPNDMSDVVKQKRLGDIEQKAAQAAARKRAGGGGGFNSSGGPYLSDDSQGLDAQTDKERVSYSVDKERMVILCKVLEDPANRRSGVRGGLKIAGTGQNIFWVFTAEEVRSATQQKCEEFTKLMNRLK